MAVLAPIARAIVTTTVMVNIGLLRSVRNAYRRSFSMAESLDPLRQSAKRKLVAQKTVDCLREQPLAEHGLVACPLLFQLCEQCLKARILSKIIQIAISF